jgi:hypothetical protein
MKSEAGIYILRLLKTINPIYTYLRIDKHSELLNNFTFDKFKGKLQVGGVKIPPKVDISKLKIIEDEQKEDVKEFNVRFKGVNYTFNTYHDKELIFYKLFQEKSKQECVVVIVDKNNKTCEIHNISYDSKCMPKAELNDKKGGSLLIIALKLINMIKDNYKLKYVQLSDNSAKYCKNKHRIELHKMLTLTTGTTWYAKYGFTPKEEIYRKQFYKNNKIMDKLLLKDIPNIKKYLIYGHKKSNSDIDINKLIKFYEYELNKDNHKLKDFLSKLLERFDRMCGIFFYFYQELYNELRLYSMGGIVFVKEL